MGKTKLSQILLLLEPRQLDHLNRLAKATGRTRMELLREAIADLFAKHGAPQSKSTPKRLV
jgi:predicted DNA-binding protein